MNEMSSAKSLASDHKTVVTLGIQEQDWKLKGRK